MTLPRLTLHFSARLLAGVGTLTLLVGIGLISSRPAHTAGGPIPVTVANTVENHDLDKPARQPFTIRVYPTASTPQNFTVPAGKRLVIQQVSAFNFGSTTVEDVALYSLVSGKASALLVPFTVNNQGIVYASQAVTDYADPGTTVTVALDDTNTADMAGNNVDIVGYYVDVP